MKLFKTILDFYINSSIHVALAVYAFVRITEMYFNLSYNEPLDCFMFYGTITGYNFVKYAGVAKLHHRSLTTHLKVIQVFSLICFLFMCYYAWQLSINTLMLIAPFGFLTLLYAVPFLSGFQKNLRSVGYLKIIVVALVWMGATVFLPVFDAKVEFTNTVSLISLQRFLLVVILILPFDIRDVKYDAISLQTIPRKIGVKNTKKLGIALLVICLLLEFLITENTVFRKSFVLISFMFLILLVSAKENQSKYYSSFIVEAIPIIWLVFLSVF